MGWCSATEIFDKVLAEIIDTDLPEENQERVVRVLIDALEEGDWDCQQDSSYYDHPFVREIFEDLHPDWFRDEYDDE